MSGGGGFGEVRVALGLDDSQARSKLASFFKDIGNQDIKDPLKGLDRSFEAVAKKAKDLGYAWDQTSKTFKNSQGVSRSVNEIKDAIATTAKAARDGGTSFGQMAQSFKQLDNEGKAFSRTASDTATTFGNLGKAGQTAGQQLQGIGKSGSQGLTQLDQNAKGATQGIGLLGKAGQTTGQQLQGLGQGGGQGISQLGQAAKSSAQGVTQLGQAGQNAGSALKVFASTGSAGIKTIGTDAKGAATGVTELGKGATTAGTQLKTINGNGLKDVYTQASSAGKAATSAATGASTLAKGLATVASSGKPIGQVSQALNQTKNAAAPAATSVGTLSQALRNAGQGAQPLSAIPTQLQKIGPAAANGAATVGKLPQVFNTAGQSANTFGNTVRQSFQNILNGIPQGIGLAIGQAILAPLKAATQILPQAVAEFSKLDESVRLTLSIVGEGADKFNTLSSSISAVSSVTAATAQEVANVAQSLARAGFSLEEIDQALEGIVKGAEATGTSYEDMGRIVVSALGAFGLAAADAADVADTLTVAANGANTDVNELGDALKYVGPVAASVGQNLQETNLQLQVLANSGIKASSAGTSLRTILTNLQIASAGASEEFTSLSRGSARLGKAIALIGADLTDTNGELKTGKELVTALQTAMADLDPGERAIVSKVLAGSEGLPALNALISASGAELDAFADALDNRAGKAAQTADQALSGLSGSFKLLQSNVSGALKEIGATIATVLKPVIDIATAILVALNKLPGPIKTIAVAFGVLGVAVGATVVTLEALKGSIVATFAANSINAIKNFVAALTAANIQTAIAGMVNGFKSFSTILTGSLIKGLNGATSAIKALGAAIKSGALVDGAVTAFKAITTGLAGIPAAAAPAVTQLGLFTAGSTAAGAAGTAGSAGIAATGVASAAATPGVAALTASMGAFLVAIAPIAAAIGVVVGAIAIIKGRMDDYKAVVDPLKESHKILEEGLNKVGSAANENAPLFQSWGKKIEDSLGPLDGLLSKLGPVYPALKLVAEGLGRLSEWDKANRQIAALAQETYKFKQSLDFTNAAIAVNRKRMAELNPASEEYGKLAKQNTTLIEAQRDAITNRIKALDGQIKAMESDERANKRQIEALKAQKAALEGQLPIIEQNVQQVRNEAKAYEDATGKIVNVTAKMAELKIARENAYNKAAAGEIYNEIQALQDLNDGLISESETRAIVAGKAVESSKARIDAVNKEIEEVTRLYNEGQITQEEYDKAYEDATKEIEKEAKKRIEAELEYKKAVKAAIDEALTDYQRLVQGIGSATQQINNMLGDLGSVGSSGLSAFKSLANEVTNFEIGNAERAKTEKIKNIEEAGARQKKVAEKLGKDTEAIDKRTAKAKEAAEEEYVNKRKAIMQKQIDFEAKAAKLAYAQKKLELDLWYEQQTVANQIATQEAKIAQIKAKAAGASTEEINLLKEVVALQEKNGDFIGTMYDLKKDVLEIEQDITEQQINSKAAAEGVNSAFGSSVTTIGQIEAKMDDFIGKVNGARTEVSSMKDNFGEIPDYAEQAAADAVARIENGIRNTDFSTIKDALVRSGFSEEIATKTALSLQEGFGEGAELAINGLQNSFLNRFPDAIPKALIKDTLIQAIVQGSDASLQEAQSRFARFPDAMPTEQIANILGNAVGGGYEQGLQMLAQMPLPEGVFVPLTNSLGQAIDGAVQKMPESVRTEAEKIPGAITDSLQDVPATFGTVGYDASKQFTDMGRTVMMQGISDAVAASGELFKTGWAAQSAFVGTLIKEGLSEAGQEGGQLAGEGVKNITAAAVEEAPKTKGAFEQIFEGLGNIGKDWGNKTALEANTELVQGVADVGGKITDTIGAGIASGYTAGMAPAITDLVDNIKTAGTEAGTGFGDNTEQTLGTRLTAIGTKISEVWNKAVDAAKEAGGAASDEFSNEMEKLVQIVDENAETIGKKYGDMIPKEEVYEDLYFSLTDGTREGSEEAYKILGTLPDAIPRDEVARILGEGIGAGVEEGQQLLDTFTLTAEAKAKLEGDVAAGLGEGAKEGAKKVGQEVDKQKEVKSAIAKNVKEGADEGFGYFQKKGADTATNLEQLFTKAGSQSGKNFAAEMEAAVSGTSDLMTKALDAVEFTALGNKLGKVFEAPLKQLNDGLRSLVVPEELPEQMENIKTSAEGIKNAGVKSEMKGASSNSRTMSSAMKSAKSAARSMAGHMKSVAKYAAAAARSSSNIKSARAMGGPVQGGQSYQVNELGREMFMSKAGTISEIRAKPFGDWRAPSSGTVIPAHIAQQVREAKEAGKANKSIAMLHTANANSSTRTVNNYDQVGLQGALVRELKNLSGSNSQVTNNVQITSANPITDASRVMADLARLRAMRRR